MNAVKCLYNGYFQTWYVALKPPSIQIKKVNPVQRFFTWKVGRSLVDKENQDCIEIQDFLNFYFYIANQQVNVFFKIESKLDILLSA